MSPVGDGLGLQPNTRNLLARGRCRIPGPRIHQFVVVFEELGSEIVPLGARVALKKGQVPKSLNRAPLAQDYRVGLQNSEQCPVDYW